MSEVAVAVKLPVLPHLHYKSICHLAKKRRRRRMTMTIKCSLSTSLRFSLLCFSITLQLLVNVLLLYLFGNTRKVRMAP